MAASRRLFLKAGLAGGALLTVGGVGLGLQPGVLGPVPASLQVLDATTWSVTAAVARRMCLGGGPSPDVLDVASRVDAQLSVMHPSDAAEVVQGLMLLENGLAGLVLGGGRRPFTGSSEAAQTARLRAWQQSPLAVLRKAYKAIRGLVVTAYYSHPGTYTFTGYPGPPDFGQASAPAIQVAQVRVPPTEDIDSSGSTLVDEETPG